MSLLLPLHDQTTNVGLGYQGRQQVSCIYVGKCHHNTIDMSQSMMQQQKVDLEWEINQCWFLI